MTSIGETLRRERLQQGLELQQVSEATKIGTRMLQAMEQDDFSKLPGGVFTRSFIKQYASALGLNPGALTEQLKNLDTGTEDPVRSEPRKDVIPEHSHYSLSEYKSSTNSGSLLMSVVWVLLAMAGVGGVYYVMNRPSGNAPPQAQPKSGTPEQAKPEQAKPEPAKPEQPTPGQAGSSAPQQTEAAAATPAAVTPAVASAEKNAVNVILIATENAWISVFADGESVFVGNMSQNERRTFSAQTKLKLITGNAGALSFELNGRPVDAVGPKGQVRVVEFSQGGAHVVPRAPPKPAALP